MVLEQPPSDELVARALDAGARALIWDAPSPDVLASPSLPTLAIVSDETMLRAAVLAGARGAIYRGASEDELVYASLAVAFGLLAFEPAMLEVLRERRAAPEGEAGLTPRELQVLALLGEGLSNKQIAAKLAISEHTAKFHVNAILAKLSADTRTEAVVAAARRGLLML